MDNIRFLAVNYLLGPLLGLLICLLEALRRIKFLNFYRFPIWEERLIIVSNHPSMLEPVILPLMGFPWMNFPWIFSPSWQKIRFSLKWFKQLQEEFLRQKRWTPVSTPDKQNFYDPPYLGVLQPVNEPINRKGDAARDRMATFLNLKKILENGGRVIIFPEGGRTFKAPEKIKSLSGRELGVLKDGAALLVLLTGARVLPIWVEGTDKVLPNKKPYIPRLWRQSIFNVGESFVLDRKALPGNLKEQRRAATEIIRQSLLRTGDEIDKIKKGKRK